MRLIPLGGASEIGASSLLVEIGGRRILVDAGIRMNPVDGDALPDLSRLEANPPELLVLTHAHMDHLGALPLVHASFPRLPILATPPTVALASILLGDSLRIMESRAADGEIPIYGPGAVESMLARFQKVGFGQEVRPLGDGLTVVFHVAGHILGAAMVEFRTRHERLLVTGDVSIDPQRTVPSAAAPRGPFDVVVVESTYGARLHANRTAQERALVQTVAETVAGGGRALIPAFAVGRAQEVLLILRHAFGRKEVEPFPVRVDGLVRSVCGTYAAHPADAGRDLARRIEKGDHPFYDEFVRPVEAAERHQVLDEGPCAIVSSSGMLTGGPSRVYAAALASDPASHILITGYQDDEAPGRRIQEVAAAGGGTISIDGRTIALACRASTYHLSAHADGQQIAALVASVSPGAVVLVHGEAEGRAALASRIASSAEVEVHCPDNGDTLEFQPSGRRTAAPRPVTDPIGGGRPLGEDGLAELHARLLAAVGPRRPLSAAEVARAWYGTTDVPVSEFEALRRLLHADPRFVPDRKRPYLFRLAQPEAVPALDPDAPMEQNALLALVDEALGPESGLYKKGCRLEARELLLSFQFPDVAVRRHAAAITDLAGRSRWRVVVQPEPNQAALAAAALESLPEGWSAARAPSLRVDQKTVEVKVALQTLDPDAVSEAARRFAVSTGWTLRLAPAGEGTARAREARGADGRLEINLAFGAIDRAFAALPDRPAKKSKKTGADGEFIDLEPIVRSERDT